MAAILFPSLYVFPLATLLCYFLHPLNLLGHVTCFGQWDIRKYYASKDL